MEWFRMYHEARNDAKLRTLSDAQFRTWFNLLCLAAEREENGRINYDDETLLAVEVSNGDEEILIDTIERLKKLRILNFGDGFIEFDKFTKRQFIKPSDAPEKVKERVARHRQKNVTPCNAPVTPSNADVTPCNALQSDVTPRTEQNRTEQSRTDDAYLQISNAMQGILMDNNTSHIQEAQSYLEDGFEAAVICEAIQRTQNRRKRWDYTKGILAQWLPKGIRTMAQVAEEDADKQPQQNKPAERPKMKLLTDLHKEEGMVYDI